MRSSLAVNVRIREALPGNERQDHCSSDGKRAGYFSRYRVKINL